MKMRYNQFYILEGSRLYLSLMYMSSMGEVHNMLQAIELNLIVVKD